jgi:hypothetical protein
MKTMQRRGIVIFALLLGFPALGWADNRDGASGSDGAYYRADANPGGNVHILRNGTLYSNPGTNVFVQSNPAMTRVGSTLYVVVRSTDNNKIYCTKSASPYTSWSSWVYVNGQTLDAPAIVSNSAGTQVRAYVRGTNNLLYSADLTNCPSAAAWTAPGPVMQYAPAAVSDSSGIYVLYGDTAGDFRRWQQGTTSFPVVRWSEVDQDQTGGAFYGHEESDEAGSSYFLFGYAPPVMHRAVAIAPADYFGTLASGCPAGTPQQLARGGLLTFICYVKDSLTGDFIIKNNMQSGGSVVEQYQYNWRSCMNENSFGTYTDDCDFYVQLDWFRNIASASSINLRAWVTASGSPSNQAGYVALPLRLKYVLNPANNNSPEIELLFIPYWYAQSGCIEVYGGHDDWGRHIWGFTPACVGSQNLGNGQSRFYNVNLKSYILQRFGDYFRGYHADLDLIVDRWAVTWGSGAITAKVGTSQLTSSVQHTALDVLF